MTQKNLFKKTEQFITSENDPVCHIGSTVGSLLRFLMQEKNHGVNPVRALGPQARGSFNSGSNEIGDVIVFSMAAI